MLKQIRVRQEEVQPHVKIVRIEHQRNTNGMDMTESGVRWQGNDGKGWNDITLEVPQLVQAGEGDGATGGADVVAPLVPLITCLVVEATGWNDGALGLKAFLPERAGSQAL